MHSQDAEDRLIQLTKKHHLNKKDMEVIKAIRNRYMKFCKKPKVSMIHMSLHEEKDLIGHISAVSDDAEGDVKMIGFAFCSPTDAFCRKLGQTLALVRLVKLIQNREVEHKKAHLIAGHFNPTETALSLLRTDYIEKPHWVSLGLRRM